MEIIILLIGISVLVATSFLMVFIWAVKSGQYEDEYTPSVRMLFDGTVKDKDSG
jgi:cbb3-type cytochrome oxidase maturation protein